jgi:Flp pilus assembly protein TadB
MEQLGCQQPLLAARITTFVRVPAASDQVARVHRRRDLAAAHPRSPTRLVGFRYLVLSLVWAGLVLADGLNWWRLAAALAMLGLPIASARMATDPTRPSKSLVSMDPADYH